MNTRPDDQLDGHRISTSALVGSNPTRAANNGWVRTNDRLPEKRGYYACVVYFNARKHGGKTRQAHRAVRWLEFYEGDFWMNNGAPANMILWWMELPELPTLDECKLESML